MKSTVATNRHSKSPRRGYGTTVRIPLPSKGLKTRYGIQLIKVNSTTIIFCSGLHRVPAEPRRRATGKTIRRKRYVEEAGSRRRAAILTRAIWTPGAEGPKAVSARFQLRTV